MNWDAIWQFLEKMGAYFSQHETLAIWLPIIIVSLTIFMVIRRLIGFFITLLFLAFAIAAGLAIMNYDAVREWIQNDIPEQHYEEIIKSVDGLKEELMKKMDGVQARLKEMEEEKESFQQIAYSTAYLLQRLEQQDEKIRRLQEPSQPTGEKKPSVSMVSILPK